MNALVSNQRSILFFIRITGAATMAMALLMLAVFPLQAELAEGFYTPIIALEFARHSADLQFLISDTAAAETVRLKMITGMRLDAFFPVLYGVFLALWASLLRTQQTSKRRRKIANWAIYLCLLCILADWLENHYIWQILQSREGVAPLLLSFLHLATWFKWGLIAISLGFIAYLLPTRHGISRLILMITVVVSVLAKLLDTPPILAEAMGIMVALSFFALLVLAITRLKVSSL